MHNLEDSILDNCGLSPWINEDIDSKEKVITYKLVLDIDYILTEYSKIKYRNN